MSFPLWRLCVFPTSTDTPSFVSDVGFHMSYCTNFRLCWTAIASWFTLGGTTFHTMFVSFLSICQPCVFRFLHLWEGQKRRGRKSICVFVQSGRVFFCTQPAAASWTNRVKNLSSRMFLVCHINFYVHVRFVFLWTHGVHTAFSEQFHEKWLYVGTGGDFSPIFFNFQTCVCRKSLLCLLMTPNGVFTIFGSVIYLIFPTRGRLM